MVTHTDVVNMASSGGASVTLSGVNFGASDVMATVQVMQSLCGKSSWSSTTGMLCEGGVGIGAGGWSSVRVTAAQLVGTDTAVFSYDGANVNMLCGC